MQTEFFSFSKFFECSDVWFNQILQRLKQISKYIIFHIYIALEKFNKNVGSNFRNSITSNQLRKA